MPLPDLEGQRPLVIWRHGDDFAVSCSRSDAKWFEKELGKHLIVKNRGILGPCPEEGDVSEIIVLNRILRWCVSEGGTVERIEWEADPRHVDIVIAQLGLDPKSKPVATPGIRPPAVENEAGDKQLTGEDVVRFRSVCMRIAYLAQDRPEIQFSSKEAARYMQAPTVAAWQMLKRIGRFLIGVPRVVVRYPRQPMPNIGLVYTPTATTRDARLRGSRRLP